MMIMRILTLLDMAEKVVIIELITFALTLLNELGMVEIIPCFLFLLPSWNGNHIYSNIRQKESLEYLAHWSQFYFEVAFLFS